MGLEVAGESLLTLVPGMEELLRTVNFPDPLSPFAPVHLCKEVVRLKRRQVEDTVAVIFIAVGPGFLAV